MSGTAENYIIAAKNKTSARWYKTLVLAVLAGAFIAFGAALSTAAASGRSGMDAALVKGAVFPVGLILVVVCGAELFTGNNLLLLPALNRDIKPSAMFKNWGIVYGGNLIGGVLIAVLVVFSGVMGGADSQTLQACVATAASKCNLGMDNFGGLLLRGILCNMLVCLAVWASTACKNHGEKILAVYLPVFAFVVLGFEHSIANMYYLSAGLITGARFGITVAGLNIGYALLNLLAATLGNMIGGCLIATAYWLADKEKKAPPSA